MKKVPSDVSQGTASHDIEAPDVDVPRLDVSALPGGATALQGADSELCPPELPDRAYLKNAYKDKQSHGPSKGTDDGLELSYPPRVSPASPAIATTTEAPDATSVPKPVAASRQPGAERVRGMLQTTLSSHDVEGDTDLPTETRDESMHHLVATLVEPAPIAEVQPARVAEVISDSELKAAYQRSESELEPAPRTKRRKLLWIGGLIFVVVVVIVVAVILTRDTPTPAPTAAPSPTAPSHSPTFDTMLEALIPFLPDSSQEEITLPGTPQYQALEWISGNAGVGTLPDYRIVQRYALATLYFAANGDRWTSQYGWLTNDDECKWYFTNTDACNNGVLTVLDLNSNNLYGIVPPDIGMLSNLTSLALYGNGLFATIPSSLGQLTHLNYLSIRGNKMNGTIPLSFGQLTSLTGLYLYQNELTGTIPSSLGNLTGLASLYLWSNALTGTIPSSLGQLTTLNTLTLWGNALNGTIPSFLGKMTTLTLLYLEQNDLTGTFPSFLGQLTSLTSLHLYSNPLTGTIPTSLGQLTSLKDLYLGQTLLTGTIPSSLGQLTSLTELWLQDNTLTGTVPSQVCALASLTKIVLDCENVTCGCSGGKCSCN